jgi:hypothetical protein
MVRGDLQTSFGCCGGGGGGGAIVDIVGLRRKYNFFVWELSVIRVCISTFL